MLKKIYWKEFRSIEANDFESLVGVINKKKVEPKNIISIVQSPLGQFQLLYYEDMTATVQTIELPRDPGPTPPIKMTLNTRR